MCQNYVISWDLTLFWQILFEKCFLKMFPFLGRKLSDNCQSSFSDRLLTDFYIRHWLFSDTIMLSDTFQRHFQNWSDIFLMELCNWQISDRYLTVYWQFFATDIFLTVLWQISDRFLKLPGPTPAKSTLTFAQRKASARVHHSRPTANFHTLSSFRVFGTL